MAANISENAWAWCPAHSAGTITRNCGHYTIYTHNMEGTPIGM